MNFELSNKAKQVLDKLELENPTKTQITSKERKEIRAWNPIAIREAVINAIVHNDYTKEIPPKFEIFSDRLEITSAGGLPEGLDEKEFFEGYSVPRNKEIMRIYKDLDLVEQLGSGIPRILQEYTEKCFKFTNNFTRMIFPIREGFILQYNVLNNSNKGSFTPQVTPQVRKLVNVLFGEMSREQIQSKLKLNDKRNYMDNYQNPCFQLGLIEMTIPDKPNSRLQKYRLTKKGEELKLKNKK